MDFSAIANVTGPCIPADIMDNLPAVVHPLVNSLTSEVHLRKEVSEEVARLRKSVQDCREACVMAHYHKEEEKLTAAYAQLARLEGLQQQYETLLGKKDDVIEYMWRDLERAIARHKQQSEAAQKNS